jgi:transposase InsO family protein
MLNVVMAGGVEEVWDLKKDQEGDEEIRQVIEVVSGKGKTSNKDLLEDAKLLLRDKTQLYIDAEGILRRRYRGRGLIVLPKKHRERVYQLLHCNMGHLGAERVTQLAKQRVYWPKMTTDIEQYTKKKCRCLAQRSARQQAVAPLVSIHSSEPLELVGIDFLHLDRASSGHEYILLIVDHFTRYTQAYATKNKTAATAAKHLYNDYVPRFGLPRRIVHDQGPEFENKLFASLERYCGVIRSRTTPYHPQSNGGVERMNSTVLQMLRTLPEDQKARWPEKLNKLIFAYNATKHSSTGYTPYKLMFGREPVLPIDWALGDTLREEATKAKSYGKFAHDWQRQMTEVYQHAKHNIDKRKAYNEDKWQKQKEATELQVGDKVLVRNKREQGGPGKIRARWEQDVYIVLERKPNNVVYEVQKQGDERGEKRVLHRNFLLPCELMECPTQEKPPRDAPTKPTTRSSSASKRLADITEEDEEGNSSDDNDEFALLPIQLPTRLTIQTEPTTQTAVDIQRSEPTMDTEEEASNDRIEEETWDEVERVNGAAEEEEADSVVEGQAPKEAEEIEAGREEDADDEDEDDESEESTQDDSEMEDETDGRDLQGLLGDYFGSSDEEAATFMGFEDEEQMDDRSRDEILPRTSGRISRPPPKLTYFEMGGDPISITQYAGTQDDEEEADPTVGAVCTVQDKDTDNAFLEWVRAKSRQLSGHLKSKFTVGECSQ